MKNAPIRNVSVYHSRSPQRRGLNSDPVRLTCARSAANTPIWQVNELATRILVLKIANGMLIKSPWDCQSGTVPVAAACELVTFRMVKYAAKSAAKNISSEASQMMVPTATGSGRFSRPRRRDSGMGCREPSGIVIDPETACVCMATWSLLPEPVQRSPHGTTLLFESSAVLLGRNRSDATQGRQQSRLHQTGYLEGPGRHATIHPGRRGDLRRRPSRHKPWASADTTWR